MYRGEWHGLCSAHHTLHRGSGWVTSVTVPVVGQSLLPSITYHTWCFVGRDMPQKRAPVQQRLQECMPASGQRSPSGLICACTNTQHQVVQGRSQPQTHQVVVVVEGQPKVPNEECRGVCVWLMVVPGVVLALRLRLCSQKQLSLPAALRHGRPPPGIHNDLASGARNVVIGLCVGVVWSVLFVGATNGTLVGARAQAVFCHWQMSSGAVAPWGLSDTVSTTCCSLSCVSGGFELLVLAWRISLHICAAECPASSFSAVGPGMVFVQRLECLQRPMLGGFGSGTLKANASASFDLCRSQPPQVPHGTVPQVAGPSPPSCLQLLQWGLLHAVQGLWEVSGSLQSSFWRDECHGPLSA